MGNVTQGIKGKQHGFEQSDHFQMANKELNYLTERQKVLAANLANSNTPGYVAKDIENLSLPKFSKIR